jgi:hypothetical protein
MTILVLCIVLIGAKTKKKMAIELIDVGKPIVSAGAGYVGKQIFSDTVLKKLLDFWKKKHKILVLGSTGVGKTQFINSFIDDLQFDVVKHRTHLPKEIVAEVLSERIVFLDNPGEPLKIEERRRVFSKTFIDDSYKGIINLVSYGYHETGDENKEEVSENGRVKPTFLAINREKELHHLAEWLPSAHTSKTKWIISLINKADIWQANRNEVFTYYRKSAYGKAFENANMPQRHIMLPYCAIIHAFASLRQTDFEFGEEQKYEMKRHFTEILLQLLTDK